MVGVNPITANMDGINLSLTAQTFMECLMTIKNYEKTAKKLVFYFEAMIALTTLDT